MKKEEEKIFRGELFCPGDPDLKAIKLRSHKLSRQFSMLEEDDTETRQKIMEMMIGKLGTGNFLQGPVFFHYGIHTALGDRNFFNYNTTIQDDAPVTIGNDNNFGPNLTIVTPVHPLLPDERRLMRNENGELKRLCYAKPVVIGNDCWFGAGVTVCPGVTIGDNCVVGAGSVVTRDIPANSLAAGVPCKVLRAITPEDSMRGKPEVLGRNQVIDEKD